jgi:bifunctional non-homologous end joining protein LigD
MTASFEIPDNTGSPTQPALSLPRSDGRDLRPLPLLERKRLLADLLPEATEFHLVTHLEEHGEAVYARAVELGFEGVRRQRGLAVSRRSTAAWRKIKNREAAPACLPKPS